MKQADPYLTLTINGETVRLKEVSPTTTLLEYLRNSGRIGTKEGCGDGDCGACTIALIASGSDGKPHYQAMNSCLIPLGSVAGREVVTVEGLSQGQLHPVQVAMVETGGSQCGYCTPGFVMSMFAAYYDRTLKDACVEGNLCRCTGYLAIRRAAQMIAEDQPSDRFSERLEHTNSNLSEISYGVSYNGNAQHFYRPTQLQKVLQILQQSSNATLIAGGTDLGLEISYHRREFPVMVSLEAVTELQALEETPDFVKIGSAVTLSQIEDNLRGVFPSLDEMLYWFAARQVRNRATLGGNLGTASPIADLPPVLLSLDAELNIASLAGERTLPLVDFFKGYRQTDLQPGEVIVSVKIPKHQGAHRFSQSYKVGKRGTDDISIVSAAFTIDLDDDRRILQARLAYGGVAATPARAIAIEAFLVGKIWDFATVRQAKLLLREAFTPLSDLRGSADYRNRLVANLFEKFFVEFSPNEVKS
ncbi:MAG: xanthine dehydrogenase small subunit [Leptolyngbyaceae cyanobacterium CSU_1_3]|nr:xanthine dehydrogenase small subunit [Leptolyngbyaceae cyanobacterium CSU_1_3]